MSPPLSWASTLRDQLPQAWSSFLGEDTVALLQPIGAALDVAAQQHDIVPAPHHVFRAFSLTPEDVSVIIIGQDPYPTPGHAMGWAFSVPEGVWPLPPTLKNILKELRDDTGVTPPQHGSLSSWHRQGVFLINRHLTTAAGQPGAHHRIGWAAFTDRVVEALAAQSEKRVAILWGKEAQRVAPLLGNTPTISSAHPSPLSAHRGFFGSQPFSLANTYRQSLGLRPIDWSLDQPTGCQPG